MDNLGVFFTCYKENDAIEQTLKEFRKIYQNSPIYLISDGGNNFSYLEQLLNIKTELREEAFGYTSNMDKLLSSNAIDFEKINNAAFEFLHRLKTAIQYCNTDYTLIMEPDVLVRGKLTMPKVDMVGPMANEYHPEINKLLAELNTKNNRYFGPVAGILNSKTFMKVYELTFSNKELIENIIKVQPRIVNYDYLLSVLYSIFNFTYENNPELTECKRNSSWEVSGHPLVHQHRKFYNNNYMGKYK